MDDEQRRRGRPAGGKRQKGGVGEEEGIGEAGGGEQKKLEWKEEEKGEEE